MLILNNEFYIENLELLEYFLEEMHKQSYNDITEQTYEIFDKYLHECYNADIRLTEMTQDLLGDDVCPAVFINLGECDDLNAFNFSLLAATEDREVKFSERKRYFELCDICFGSVQGLFDRIFLHFNE